MTLWARRHRSAARGARFYAPPGAHDQIAAWHQSAFRAVEQPKALLVGERFVTLVLV